MQSEVADRISARQLGYYLFWNLRSKSDFLGLSEASVLSSARAAGLKHTDTVWELLDRNGDKEATLDEVVAAVEDVYTNRRSLARSLADSQSAVAQVETAIYVTLLILLLFITAAVFDAGGLQSTWPGLSATLLSFSFIFGNSIRQVLPLSQVERSARGGIAGSTSIGMMSVQMFENSIWIFFTHPFDVGDVIFYEGSRFRVKQIKLQFVSLERVDGAAVTVPTSEMVAARLHNVTRSALPCPRRVSQSVTCAGLAAALDTRSTCRSQLAWDSVEMPVDGDASIAQLERVAAEVSANIKLNPKLYGGSFRCWFTDALPGLKIQISVYYDHSGPGVRATIMPRATGRGSCAILRRSMRYTLHVGQPLDAGLDLVAMGLARTNMHAAVCRGLTAAGLTYTLPASKDGRRPDFPATAASKVRAEALINQDPDAGSRRQAADTAPDVNATVAAANLVLLS